MRFATNSIAILGDFMEVRSISNLYDPLAFQKKRCPVT